jgi:hypothetical protein
MRFESVLCLPVWSFDGPSRQDGVCVGSLCEPLLACHSIRFSRFKLQRISHISCGFARCVPPVLRWRQGDTLPIRLTRVNTFSEHSFGLVQTLVPTLDLGNKERLPVIPEAPTGQHFGRVNAAARLLCDRLQATFRFQHALRSPVGSGGCGSRTLPPLLHGTQGVLRGEIVHTHRVWAEHAPGRTNREMQVAVRRQSTPRLVPVDRARVAALPDLHEMTLKSRTRVAI